MDRGAGREEAHPHDGDRHYVAFAKVMKYALRHRLVAYNPCAGIALPRATGQDAFEPVFLTVSEVERLVAVLEAHSPSGTLVRFAAYTGLRAAEITGLRVRDVNLATGHIEVRQTLLRLNG